MKNSAKGSEISRRKALGLLGLGVAALSYAAPTASVLGQTPGGGKAGAKDTAKDKAKAKSKSKSTSKDKSKDKSKDAGKGKMGKG